MTLVRRLMLAVLALGLTGAGAQASTIDFNEIATADCSGGSASITSDGFQFTEATGISLGICDDSAGDAANGSNYLTEFFNLAITMMPVGGGTFSLNSLDASRLHTGFVFDPTKLRITGNLSGGGTVIAVFALDDVADGPGGEADFQNFVLPSTFVNLTSVRFLGFDTAPAAYSALDNIVVNQETQTPVPEPTSLTLLGLGLAGMGARRWRQRKSS